MLAASTFFATALAASGPQLAAVATAEAPKIVLPTLPDGRPDLWDQYSNAQKEHADADAKAIARAAGFTSVTTMEKWEAEAQQVAYERSTGKRASATNLVSLITDAPTAHITSDYGVRVDPMGDGLSTHSGVDIGAPYGSAIYAASAGTVVKATFDLGYGFHVEIQHANGLRTKYCHASELLVEKGDVVEAGQQIARVGSTGRSTGSHVHFEVRQKNGVPIDPHDAINDHLLDTGDGVRIADAGGKHKKSKKGVAATKSKRAR